MKTTLYKYGMLALVLMTVIISSCKKNFLDPPSTTIYTEDIVITDPSTFEGYVGSRYTQPTSLAKAFNWLPMFTFSDEGINIFRAQPAYQLGQLSPDNNVELDNYWGDSYKAIHDCNFGLKNIGSVKFTDEKRRSQVKAELRFLRAHRYFTLTTFYGGVVLMGDSVYNLKDDFDIPALYTRATLKECVDYVLSELTAAAADLPIDNDDNPAVNWPVGRATKGAALALKSRLALMAASPLYNSGTWAQAAQAAKEVMDLNKYSIDKTQGAESYRLLFMNSKSTEVIFQQLYTLNASHDPYERNYSPNGYGGWTDLSVSQNLVDDYEMANGKLITDPTSGYNPQNPYANRDPRLTQTILTNGAMYRGRPVEFFLPGGLDTRDGPDGHNAQITGYTMYKFLDNNLPIVPGTSSGQTPWISMRYAEILLNYAEAQNEAAGPDQTVFNAINTIRDRAGMPTLDASLSQSQMRDAIRRERRVELALEGYRFFDVRRWGITATVETAPIRKMDITKAENGTITYTPAVLINRQFFPHQVWLPIPRSVIVSSNNKMAQNPGY